MHSRPLLLGSLLAATLTAVAIACDDGGSSGPIARTTPDTTSTPTASPTPDGTSPASTPDAVETPAPTPTFPAGATGAPFSATDLQTAWEAQGMEVTLGGPNPAFTGFGAEASVARLIRGEDSMDVFYLVYADSDAVEEDWELTVGEPPAAREGRAVPDHITTWWNENVVVVVGSSIGAIGSDALDSFLALGEPAASPTPSPTPSA